MTPLLTVNRVEYGRMGKYGHEYNKNQANIRKSFCTRRHKLQGYGEFVIPVLLLA